MEYRPVPRINASAASVQGRTYIWGGEDSLTAISKETAHRIDSFDPYLETWSSLTTTGHPPPCGLCDGVCASTGHYLYICGGCDTSDRYDTHLYQLDVRSLTWKQLPSYPTWNSRHCYIERSKMICNQHKLALWGGYVSNIPVRPTVNDGSSIATSQYLISRMVCAACTCGNLSNRQMLMAFMFQIKMREGGLHYPLGQTKLILCCSGPPGSKFS